MHTATRLGRGVWRGTALLVRAQLRLPPVRRLRRWAPAACPVPPHAALLPPWLARSAAALLIIRPAENGSSSSAILSLTSPRGPARDDAQQDRERFVTDIRMRIDAIPVWRLSLRVAWLIVVFLPAAVLAPLAYLVPATRGLWWRLVRACLGLAGPLFVKAAQWAATRPDLFSPRVCAVLEQLQLASWPHTWRATRHAVSSALGGRAIGEVFESFDAVPIASGSIAQVHRARIRGAVEDVAVKVVHPWSVELICLDLALARALARWLGAMPEALFLGMADAAEQMVDNVACQLDMRIEAGNLARFQTNFAAPADAQPLVRFPTPNMSLSGPTMLVASFEAGVPLMRYLECFDGQQRNEPLEQALAARGMDAFLVMLMQHNFVHGDLHPGNILVRQGDPADPLDFELVFVDAGLVTELTPDLRTKLFGLLHAVLTADGERGARLMLEQPGTQCPQPEAFVAEMQSVFGALTELPLDALPLGELMAATLGAMQRNHVRCESRFASLMVSIFVCEGLARRLHPHLNLAQLVAPYLLSDAEGRAVLARAVRDRARF